MGEAWGRLAKVFGVRLAALGKCSCGSWKLAPIPGEDGTFLSDDMLAGTKVHQCQREIGSGSSVSRCIYRSEMFYRICDRLGCLGLVSGSAVTGASFG